MSILEIELTPEMEKRLREKALRRGLDTKVYAQSVLFQDLSQEEYTIETTEERRFNVMDFRGAGRDALSNLDVQKYISELRDEWDK